jgi:phosphoribosylamine--glycine ligase
MLVSGGYPGEYEKSKKIDGLTDGGESLVFHAGTRTDADGFLETSGGRVLAVTSFGNSVQEAASKSYATLRSIRFDGMYFRKDIGNDLAGAVSVGSTV